MNNQLFSVINKISQKTEQINNKRSLNQSDLVTLNNQIDVLNDKLKDNTLTSQNQQQITQLLQLVIQTVITTPTNNNQTYKLKKQFLSNTPEALFQQFDSVPYNLSKRFIQQPSSNYQLFGGSNNETDLMSNPNQPPNVWNNSIKSIPYQNKASFPGVVGCLGSLNGCGNQPLVSNTEGIIECGNMYNQGGQQFIYPTKINDIQ